MNKPLIEVKTKVQNFQKALILGFVATKRSGESSPTQSQISKVMREMGRRGGKAKVPKGLAAMSQEQRDTIRAKALKTRLAKKKAVAD